MKTIHLPPPQPTKTADQFKTDIVAFSSGLQFAVLESLLEQPVMIHKYQSNTICFGFCLAGQFEARADCYKAPLTIKAGECGVFTIPKPLDIFENIGNGRLHRIYLMLKCDSLLSMAQEDEDRFYSVLKSLGKKSSAAWQIP